MSERSAAAAGPAGSVSEELSALLQERERYELWLKQLVAKKDSTPKAVFERVHGDYTTRLKAVLERVAGRTGELRSQIEALEVRLAIVEREHGEVRDERAEAELRHQVGEFTEDQWREISAHTDEAMNRATLQRTEIAMDIAKLREIFAAATGSDTGAAERGGIAASEAAVEEEVAPPVAVAAPVAEEKKAAPRVPEPVAAAPAPRVSDAMPARTSATMAAPISDEPARISRAIEVPADAMPREQVEEARPAATAAPAPAPPRESGAIAAPASAAPARNDGPVVPARATPRRTSGFDDLAFVSSLVTPDDRRTPVTPAAAIPMASPPPADTSAKTERAPARPSGAETPSSFMKGVRGEAVKSLKCQECGTLNYPTEWYCERCGGELAAL